MLGWIKRLFRGDPIPEVVWDPRIVALVKAHQDGDRAACLALSDLLEEGGHETLAERIRADEHHAKVTGGWRFVPYAQILAGKPLVSAGGNDDYLPTEKILKITTALALFEKQQREMDRRLARMHRRMEESIARANARMEMTLERIARRTRQVTEEMEDEG